MSLPTNYRQVAMMGPTPTPGPTHVYMPASPMMSNILKERLARSSGGSGGKGVGEANVPSPFSTPVHGNPAFNPQKMGSGKSTQGAEGRIPKPPKAPDKPLMPYMRYSRKVWDQVKAANSDLKLWEIGKIIGSMWRDLPEADKQDFVDEYEAEKAEYTKALEEYHNSPAYKQYLAAKAKGSASTEEKEIVERATSSLAPGTKLDRRIDIQPAEDDDSQYHDDGISVKQVSHARYARNHRLANEIFSDTLVPDVRSVVTTQRLSVLRRQVQSLTMHQKKLETELQQIEEKFEAKKRKFVEAGDSFQSELKKVKAMAPKLDHASFLAMVERQREVLRREAEERQRTAQGLPPRPPSTSSPQATTTAAAPREEGGEATGPAPQNTATLVDAPSPAPPQDSSESGGDTESKGEASTPVTPAVSATTTAAPVTTPAAAANPATTTTTANSPDATNTTSTTTTPAVNGPTTPIPSTSTSASSSPSLPPQPPTPATTPQEFAPNPAAPTQGNTSAPTQPSLPSMSEGGTVGGVGQTGDSTPSGGSLTSSAPGEAPGVPQGAQGVPQSAPGVPQGASGVPQGVSSGTLGVPIGSPGVAPGSPGVPPGVPSGAPSGGAPSAPPASATTHPSQAPLMVPVLGGTPQMVLPPSPASDPTATTTTAAPTTTTAPATAPTSTAAPPGVPPTQPTPTPHTASPPQSSTPPS